VPAPSSWFKARINFPNSVVCVIPFHPRINHPMSAPLLFLAQTSTTSHDLLLLRRELLPIIASLLLLFIALFAIAVFFFRRTTRDLTLIYFGLFCALYAVRLLANQQTTSVLFGYSPTFWGYIDWLITCTILLPFSLFLFQIVGERLRKLLRWLLAFQAVFAVVGVIAAALRVRLAPFYAANSIVVFATLFTAGVFLLTTLRSKGSPPLPLTREVRIFIAGFLVWFVFIVHANLLGLRVIPGRNVEYLGFLVFVGCLGYIAARRTFANEERLLAIQKELEIAQQIQSSTLPRDVPNLPGIDIAARYLPMSAVAGDFYDFLVVDEKRIGVLIADVTGHGVPAALIASMLKVAFAAQFAHADDPARVLTGLNRALCGKFEEHFVTAAYLFADLEKSILRYSAAGHPPLLLASASHNGVREIEQNGLMLGMFPEATYSATEILVHPGDRCLLYTDGVFEAKNSQQEEFGMSRSKNFFGTHTDSSAVRFANALLDEISHFAGHDSGRPREDDITLLVLDFRNSK
jgi:phosphoserine phosphatase RsbU/P